MHFVRWGLGVCFINYVLELVLLFAVWVVAFILSYFFFNKHLEGYYKIALGHSINIQKPITNL